MKENKELNKKLLEFAGFKFGHIKGEGNYYSYLSSDEKFYGCIDFTESLDACFKWLVPKVLEKLIPVSILAYPVSGKYPNIGFHCELNGEAKQYPTEAGNPALALCKAIEQLIDKQSIL